MAQTRWEFLSFFFARHISAEHLAPALTDGCHSLAMAAVLAEPLDPGTLNDVFSKLEDAAGREKACTYSALVKGFTAAPYVDAPGARICDVVCTQGNPGIRDPDGRPDSSLVSSCSLQLGEGWLASEASYTLVRSRLSRSKISFKRANVFTEAATLVDPHARTVLYVSNVLSIGLDQAFESFTDFIHDVHCSGSGYLHISRFETQVANYFQQDVTEARHDMRYKKHISALHAVSKALHPYVQVLEITHQVPYGFSEFDDGQAVCEANGTFYAEAVPRLARVNILPQQILRELPLGRGPPDVACVLHILFANGLSEEAFSEAFAAALFVCKRVVVLEHNPDSADFSAERHASGSEAWLGAKWNSVLSIKHRLGVAARRLPQLNMVLSDFHCVVGLKDGCRNVILTFDRIYPVPDDFISVWHREEKLKEVADSILEVLRFDGNPEV